VREPRHAFRRRRGVPGFPRPAPGPPQPGDFPLLLPERLHHPRLRRRRGDAAGRQGGRRPGLLRGGLRPGRVAGGPRGAGADAARARRGLHPLQFPQSHPRHAGGGAARADPDRLPADPRHAAADEPGEGAPRLRRPRGEPALPSAADVRRRRERRDGGQLPYDGGPPGGGGPADAGGPGAKTGT